MAVFVRVVVAATLALLVMPSAARSRLVYDKDRGAVGVPASVWIARDDGSAPRRLASGYCPRISPSGRTVVYERAGTRATRFTGSLMEVPARGGAPSVLVSRWRCATSLAWSPDSRTLATVAGRRLVLVDVASGVARTVATGAFFGVSFSPAGTKIVYARAARRGFPLSGADLYTARVGGGPPRRITRGGRSVDPVWGPAAIVLAGERRARRRNDVPKRDLYLVNPDGSGLRRLTRTQPPFQLAGLTAIEWSADGRRLLAELGGEDTNFAETVDASTGRVRNVGHSRPGAPGIQGFRLSRDGRTILATTGLGYDPAPPHDVITIPYGGGRPTVLARHAYDPDWTR